MKKILSASFLMLFALHSCNRPETTVVNFVRPDGSVLREIVMKHSGKNFSISNVQVPYDTTWIITDTLEINPEGDTLWVRRAEKLFRNFREMNDYYETDSSFNREEKRRVEFKKSFRWFNTAFRFAEIIEARTKNGYPLSRFMEKSESEFFYSPESLKEKLLKGPDSLRYKAIEESVNSKTTEWIIRSFVAEWSELFSRMVKEKTSGAVVFDNLKSKEDSLYRYLDLKNKDTDSLWNSGVILSFLVGEEYASRFRAEADSAMNEVQEVLLRSFSNYTEKTFMPGRLTGTSGFADSTGYVLWPVKSEYFMTEPYVMWAESEKTNIWAWVITIACALYFLYRLAIRRKGRAGRL